MLQKGFFRVSCLFSIVVEFKGVVNRTIMLAVSIVPVQASEQALAIVKELVQQTYQVSGKEEHKNSPAYLEWDATTSFIECWVNGLKQVEGLVQVKYMCIVVYLHISIASCTCCTCTPTNLFSKDRIKYCTD